MVNPANSCKIGFYLKPPQKGGFFIKTAKQQNNKKRAPIYTYFIKSKKNQTPLFFLKICCFVVFSQCLRTLLFVSYCFFVVFRFYVVFLILYQFILYICFLT